MAKSKKEFLCMCKTCGKSSNAGNSCAYEEQEKMSYCQTFIRIKEKKPKK